MPRDEMNRSDFEPPGPSGSGTGLDDEQIEFGQLG
jgi:hypothetical protein